MKIKQKIEKYLQNQYRNERGLMHYFVKFCVYVSDINDSILMFFSKISNFTDNKIHNNDSNNNSYHNKRTNR